MQRWQHKCLQIFFSQMFLQEKWPKDILIKRNHFSAAAELWFSLLLVTQCFIRSVSSKLSDKLSHLRRTVVSLVWCYILSLKSWLYLKCYSGLTWPLTSPVFFTVLYVMFHPPAVSGTKRLLKKKKKTLRAMKVTFDFHKTQPAFGICKIIQLNLYCDLVQFVFNLRSAALHF